MTEWLKRAKEWWWALSLILGATVFVATLPMRLSKVEAGVEEAQESVSDLELWAKELQGYTRAQNEMNQQIRIQQAPPRIDRYWDEQERRYYCDDGTQLWWADDNGRCE